ncbi:MAG: WD40/YVTN/BNR-like repeat-containing protein [Actinomycetota bacterium]
MIAAEPRTSCATPSPRYTPGGGAAAIDADRAFVTLSFAGGAGYSGVTTDGGANWTEFETPCAPGSVLDIATAGALWIRCGFPSSGDAGDQQLARSVDGGEMWLAAGFLPDAADGIAALSAERALVSVAGDGMYATVDGGATWTRVLGGAVLKLEVIPRVGAWAIVALRGTRALCFSPDGLTWEEIAREQ